MLFSKGIFMGYKNRLLVSARIPDRSGTFKGIIGLRAALILITVCTLRLANFAAAQSRNLADLSSEGKAALRDQQFDRAEKVYEQVVMLDPRSAEAHSNLGLALYMTGGYPRAITEFRKALELDPHLDRTPILLALTYFDSGEFERAVPLLEKAYQTRKDDPVVVAHLGLAYLRQNKDDKALAMLSHWAELEPNSPDALYFKGKASVYVASDAFDQLSKAAPDSYRMFQLRAEMLRQQGRRRRRSANTRKQLLRSPTQPDFTTPWAPSIAKQADLTRRWPNLVRN